MVLSISNPLSHFFGRSQIYIVNFPADGVRAQNKEYQNKQINTNNTTTTSAPNNNDKLNSIAILAKFLPSKTNMFRRIRWKTLRIVLLTSIVWVLAGFCILFFYVDCIGPYGCSNQSTSSSLAIQNGSSLTAVYGAFSEQRHPLVNSNQPTGQFDQQASVRSLNIRGRVANYDDLRRQKVSSYYKNISIDNQQSTFAASILDHQHQDHQVNNLDDSKLSESSYDDDPNNSNSNNNKKLDINNNLSNDISMLESETQQSLSSGQQKKSSPKHLIIGHELDHNDSLVNNAYRSPTTGQLKLPPYHDSQLKLWTLPGKYSTFLNTLVNHWRSARRMELRHTKPISRLDNSCLKF